MLAELGLVGLALLVLACVALLRGSLRRSGHELALALLLPAFLVHSLVDVDWDFVAVAAPAFVAAGALVGGPAERRLRGFSLLPAFGVALVVLGSLGSPWLARRWVDRRADGRVTRPRARSRLRTARTRSTRSCSSRTGQRPTPPTTKREAYRQYVLAVQRQPKNPLPWLLAGEFALRAGCPYAAWQHLERYTELDQKSNGPGGDEYNAMLKLVDAHKYTC